MKRSVRRRGGWAMPALAAMIFLALALAAGCASGRGAAKADRPSAGGVSGTVYAPVEGVYIYVYKKGADPYGPAYVILPSPTREDGTFSVVLAPGEYTVVARRRANLENSGPLSEGDLRSAPVTIRVGEDGRVPLTLLMSAKADGKVKVFQPPKDWSTAIAGIVLDPDGNPVDGARVHVYTYVQMSERPKYVSERTGPDGTYIVYLPKGGTYYLAARNRFGGPPRIGDLYGRYDEGSIDPTGVVVKEGEIRKNIDITVFKVW
jgi:hypothetical protein